jgi:hypothetical protein
MSKKSNKRHHLKGGFLDYLKSSLGSITEGASDFWNKTKKATGMGNSSSGSSSYSSYSNPSYTPPASSGTSYSPPVSSGTSYSPTTSSSSYNSYEGGRRRRGKNRRSRKSRRSRKIKRGGGYGTNTSLTNLAATAAPYSGQTAKAHNWVGGKKNRRTRHKSRG